jgi:hypothetical protein
MVQNDELMPGITKIMQLQFTYPQLNWSPEEIWHGEKLLVTAVYIYEQEGIKDDWVSKLDLRIQLDRNLWKSAMHKIRLDFLEKVIFTYID